MQLRFKIAVRAATCLLSYNQTKTPYFGSTRKSAYKIPSSSNKYMTILLMVVPATMQKVEHTIRRIANPPSPSATISRPQHHLFWYHPITHAPTTTPRIKVMSRLGSNHQLHLPTPPRPVSLPSRIPSMLPLEEPFTPPSNPPPISTKSTIFGAVRSQNLA